MLELFDIPQTIATYGYLGIASIVFLVIYFFMY